MIEFLKVEREMTFSQTDDKENSGEGRVPCVALRSNLDTSPSAMART